MFRVVVANICLGGRVYKCQCGGNAAHGMHVPTRTSAAVRRFEGPRCKHGTVLRVVSVRLVAYLSSLYVCSLLKSGG